MKEKEIWKAIEIKDWMYKDFVLQEKADTEFIPRSLGKTHSEIREIVFKFQERIEIITKSLWNGRLTNEELYSEIELAEEKLLKQLVGK